MKRPMRWEPRDVRAAGLPDLVEMCGPLAEELEVTKTRLDQTSSQGGRRSTDAAPFVFRLGAAEVLDRIAVVLRSIIGQWTREQGGFAYRMDEVPDLVEQLRPHLSWVAKHQRAGEWRDELEELCLSALQQVDIPEERRFIGRCGAGTPECPTELWPVLGEAYSTCPTCGTRWDVEARTDVGLRKVERWEAPLSRIVELLRGAGEQISLPQARKWAQRVDAHGRPLLAPVGTDEQGTQLYRLGAVRQVLERMHRRSAHTSSRR